jgi:lipopolysaccharide export system permease protein
VWLPPIPEDTVVDNSRPSLYCRGLAFAARLVQPTVAEAQGARREIGPVDQDPQPVRQSIPRVRPTEVRVHRDRARSSRVRAAVHAVELQKKYSIPATCIVFVLVGVPLGMRFPRGGLGLVLGASMVVFSVYYVGLIAGESLANRLTLSPFLAMWASNILMATLGVLGILWQRRSGSVSRRRFRRRTRRVPRGEAA